MDHIFPLSVCTIILFPCE